MVTLRMRLRAPESSHDIVIGPPLRTVAKDILRPRKGVHTIVITDANVGRYYGALFRARRQTGSRVDLIEVPPGEASKSRMMKERLEDRLLALGADRRSLIIALGGGVIGDLAGFIAATYMRGIPYVQIPTSLLAQVDSSVGGKVAVNHPRAKNLIGAFYQPRRTYIDPATLKTLPDRELYNGLAEVVKYGAIMDRRFFTYLERNHERILRRDLRALSRVVVWCCRLKRSVVERDERESGPRRILNFGHTIGHAVEALSGYRIAHGRSVAIGMAAEADLAVRLGMLADADAKRIRALLRAFHLPTAIPPRFTTRDIVRETLHDKKIRDGIVQYTLPVSIGRGVTGVPVSFRMLGTLLAP